MQEKKLKKKLWLLSFFMAVASYCYYEKVCRTMCTTITLYLFNIYIYIHPKSKVTENIFNLQEWHHNTKTIISYKTFTVGKKTKTCQEQPNFVSSHLIQVSYKTTTFPKQQLFSGSKSGRLIQV